MIAEHFRKIPAKWGHNLSYPLPLEIYLRVLFSFVKLMIFASGFGEMPVLLFHIPDLLNDFLDYSPGFVLESPYILLKSPYILVESPYILLESP